MTNMEDLPQEVRAFLRSIVVEQQNSLRGGMKSDMGPDAARKLIGGVFDMIAEESVQDIPTDGRVGSLAGDVLAVAAVVEHLLDRIDSLESQLFQLQLEKS